MSRNYKFLNPEGLYFVSFTHTKYFLKEFVHPLRSSTVVMWLDVFTRNEYIPRSRAIASRGMH